MEHIKSWHTLAHDLVRVFLPKITVMLALFWLSVPKIHLTCFFRKKAPCFTIIDVIKSWPVPAKQVGILSVFMTVTSIFWKHWEKNLVLMFKRKQVQGFFPTGDWGVPPRQQKFCPSPQPTTVPTFWPELVPPNWVLSTETKISKILPHFTLNFDYFLAQNCFQKALFYALIYYQNLL